MSFDFSYDPTVCDLCGSRGSSTLLELNTKRAMRSDRVVVGCHLKKVRCTRCGLVRSGQRFEGEILHEFYAGQYTLGVQPEHDFYTPQGPVPRSRMLCDWMVSSMGGHRWRSATRCLEIGAGSGALLQEFGQRFPGIVFEGLELNAASVALGRARGLRIHQGVLSDLAGEPYDIIYAVAVIEHCPSPTRFLEEIRKQMQPGGWLFLLQPTQDVSSYDIFFIDHLHHFGSQHLQHYALKCGFRERGLVVGHEWMPNFSLHLWQTGEQNENHAWVGPPGYTTCVSTARDIETDMAGLNATLERLAAGKRRVAVFGLNEAYWLARAYSALDEYPIVCGLDDRPDKPEYARLGFPVVVPEECVSFGVQDVLLTMNAIYYPQARQRLGLLGVTVHPIFREPAPTDR